MGGVGGSRRRGGGPARKRGGERVGRGYGGCGGGTRRRGAGRVWEQGLQLCSLKPSHPLSRKGNASWTVVTILDDKGKIIK